MKQLDQSGIVHPVLVVVVIAVIGITGLAGYQVFGRNKNANLNSSQSASPTKTVLPENMSDVLPVSSLEKVVGKSESAQVASVALKNKAGVLVYEVMLTNGTKITVNAITGVKTKTETVAVGENETLTAPVTLNTKLSIEEARDIAQKQFPNSKIARIQLEAEEGKLVYSVRFSDKARVDVNATDGSIVKSKQAKEQKATPGTPNAHASSTAKSATSKETGKSVKSGSSSKSSSSGKSGQSGSSSNTSTSGDSSSGGSTPAPKPSDDNNDSSHSGSDDGDDHDSDDDNSGSGSHSGSDRR